MVINEKSDGGWKSNSIITALLVVGIIGLILGGLLVAGWYSAKTSALKVKLSELDQKYDAQTELNAERAIEVKGLKDKVVGLEAIMDSADALAKDAQLSEAKVEELNGAMAKLQEQNAKLNEQLAVKASGVVISDSGKEYQESKTVDFGEAIGSIVLDDSDMSQLQDGKVRVDGDRYDIQDKLRLTSEVILGVSGDGADEDFGSEPHILVLKKDAIRYTYYFDDTIKMSDVSEDVPLRINFLGQDVEIVDVDSNGFKVRQGLELSDMKEGEERTVAVDDVETTVKLVVVSDSTNKVVVEVNGERSKVLADGQSDLLDNGYSVTASDILPNEAGDEGADLATVWISSGETLVEYDNGGHYDEDKVWKLEVESELK